MEIVIADEVQVEERKYPTRPGLTRTQALLSCEGPDGLSFRLVRSQYQEGEKAFVTPRHHHTFQQIRFAEKGKLNFAPDQYIPEGDIAYFPRAAWYGPQLRDHGVGITIQFGFDTEMIGGKDALRVYQEGVEKLRGLGEVGNGVFSDVDPETGQVRQRDTWQAVAEEFTGGKFVFPPEAYSAPVLMHTEAFAYFEAEPGVEIRNMGSFFDHFGPNGDVRIATIRLSDGGVHKLGADRSHLIWSMTDGLEIDGSSFPRLTCVFCPIDEEATLSSKDTAELFCITFPRRD